MLIAFNKPFDVLSQFTPECEGQRTLAEFDFPRGVYPLGRLDRDSEGLLLLSDEKGLNSLLLDPERGHWRTYWAQVEGIADEEALRRLSEGVPVGGRMTLPARARVIFPEVPPRNPPIRFRKSVPDSWIELELCEGRNRQVRRMTAAVGLPTLRLLRVAIGGFQLPVDLETGKWVVLGDEERRLVFGGSGGTDARGMW
jgi:23S rRNA pseudouridine2457 synthase